MFRRRDATSIPARRLTTLRSKNRRFFEFNFTKNGVQTDVKGKHVAAYNDIESALTGALAWLGIVQLPLYIPEEHLRAGSLVPVLADYGTEGVLINSLRRRVACR